ncbi:hypothetical protein [Dokdonella sp.]|uniref:hypothetical protein n=1 Tax=Dokdonella sp. TaxID=2291710 RepID=UPI003C5F0DF2
MSEPAPAPYVVDIGDVARDRGKVLGLWRGNLGEDVRMQSKFDWFYAKCPFGEPTLCLLRHVADGSHVGVASAGPRKMLVGGSAMEAGVLVDLAVGAEHRSLGPAMMLQAAIAEHGAARFSLLYGFPNPKAAPVFKRVGYSKLGEIVRHARVLRHADYLARRMPRALATMGGWLVDIGVRLRDGWRARSDPRLLVLWSDAADPRFDSLWARSAPDSMALSIRDYAFARWRFDQCPFEKTQFLLLSDPANGDLQAWFACQVKDNTLHVRDFWSAEAATGVSRTHVDALLAEARKQGHAALSIEIAGRSDRLEGWRAAGFSARGKRPVFGKWSDGRNVDDVDLYLTSADEDE